MSGLHVIEPKNNINIFTQNFKLSIDLQSLLLTQTQILQFWKSNMNDRAHIEIYLDQKVNPLLEELLTNVIKNKPKNVLNYCRGWFQKKSENLQMFPQLSDSDSEDEDSSRLNDLLQRKNRNKWYEQRKGICGQVYGSHHLWQQFQVPTVQRKSTVNSRILFRLKSLFLFKDFDDHDINRLIAAMTEITCHTGTYVVREGDIDGDMYIIDSGQLQILKGPKGQESLMKVLKQGQMFGEMSMLYNTPRWASVKATCPCVLFKLDRKTYHCLVNQRNLRKRKIFQAALNKIQIFKQLQIEQRYKLQDLIKEIPIHLNQYVVREGKLNKTFYIVETGKFISLKKEKSGHDKIIGYYNEGDVFGDSCLYSKCQADQSIMSLTNGKLYAIERDGLERVLGSIVKIMKRSIDIYQKYKNYQKV